MSKLLDEAKKNLEKVKREKQLANNSVSLHGLGGKGLHSLRKYVSGS